ncbi:MAG: hypothetical protein ACUVXF_05940 [Desulfobaccales bacterium]
MSGKSEPNQLKVCCTCAYWSYKFKGFCHRLDQGVGKFWICEDWTAAAAEAGETEPETVESATVAGLRV